MISSKPFTFTYPRRYFYTVGNPTGAMQTSNAHYLGRFHSHALYHPFINCTITIQLSEILLYGGQLDTGIQAPFLLALRSVLILSAFCHALLISDPFCLCCSCGYDPRGSVTCK